MNIDADQAMQFLSLLDAGGVYTFQTFDDSPEGKRSWLIRVLHGQFDDLRPTLETLNNSGAGIFVMVNAGDGLVRSGARSCRTSDNVVAVRAVFLDLDGAPIEPVLDSAVPPDWTVQSSPDRWHAYWKVDDCPRDEFTGIQAALSRKYGGDPSVKDLARVMRIPGFMHRKKNPFMSLLYLPDDYESIRSQEHA